LHALLAELAHAGQLLLLQLLLGVETAKLALGLLAHALLLLGDLPAERVGEVTARASGIEALLLPMLGEAVLLHASALLELLLGLCGLLCWQLLQLSLLSLRLGHLLCLPTEASHSVSEGVAAEACQSRGGIKAALACRCSACLASCSARESRCVESAHGHRQATHAQSSLAQATHRSHHLHHGVGHRTAQEGVATSHAHARGHLCG
jgi:hypothetical protein